jgi:RND superfamily putative drug exporter
VLAAALAIIAVLAVLGLGVKDDLRPVSIGIAGTESDRAGEMVEEHFGETAPFAILLQGPPRALDRQGPALIEALREDPSVSTISPWDRGSVERLRPGPRKALILADFHVGSEQAVEETVPYLERTLEREISPPVRATQSGFASLLRALQHETVESTERAELIAIPFLLIVLLLVFRSPVAAAIPLAFGAVTVISSRGVLAIASNWIAIDGFALTVCSMMGLALGVDYALLMVSRFREELLAGAAPLEAARMTRRTAGRTTAFAGSTLFLAMIALLFVMPGTLLISLAGTAILVTAISVIVAARPLAARPHRAQRQPLADRRHRRRRRGDGAGPWRAQPAAAGDAADRRPGGAVGCAGAGAEDRPALRRAASRGQHRPQGSGADRGDDRARLGGALRARRGLRGGADHGAPQARHAEPLATADRL